MNLAWIMYASDSGDKLITNRPYASAAELPLDNWMAGVMDWTANPQSTNHSLLLAAALGSHLKNAQIYRCPTVVRMATRSQPPGRVFAAIR